MGATGGASSGAVGSREAAGSAGTRGWELKAYARLLSEAVARQRHYPPSAARLGMEGTARVQLNVLSDGSLLEPPRLVRSSGQEVLDTEALRMVQAAAPFQPMPQAASRSSTGFVIPVVFSLRSGT